MYLDEDWINGEAQVTELLREAGLISEDQPQPTPRVHRSGDRRGDLPDPVVVQTGERWRRRPQPGSSPPSLPRCSPPTWRSERRECGARRPRIRCSARSTLLLIWQIASILLGYRVRAAAHAGRRGQRRCGTTSWGTRSKASRRDGVRRILGDPSARRCTGSSRALALGVPIGILMGRYRYAKNFFFDLVYLAANIPLIVYAILGLILFGLGDAGPAFVVALLVLPVIALNVAAGVEGVDRNLIAMSRAYHRPASSGPAAHRRSRRSPRSCSLRLEVRSPRRGSWRPSRKRSAGRSGSASRSARRSRASR